MNLCGGIVNVSEHELLMEMPEDRFSMKPRRKSSTPSSSRRRKAVPSYVETHGKAINGSRSSRSSSRSRSRTVPGKSSSTNGPEGSGPGFLNPLSREDIRKSKSRQRPSQMKPSAGTLKKLEDGFNLKLLADDGETRNTNLQLEQDRVHLRIHSLDKDLNLGKNSEDSENDGSKSNFADIRLKVQDLARLEVGTPKHSTSKGSSFASGSSFTLIMKKSIGDTNILNFEADSLAGRDLVVAALKGLLEQTKLSDDRRNRSILAEDISAGTSQRKKERRSRSRGKSESSSHRYKMTYKIEGEDENLESKAVLCGFDDENIIDTFSQRFSRMVDIDSTTIESRDEGNTKSPISEQDVVSPDKDAQGPREGRELSLVVVENPGLREMGVEVAGIDWGLDDILCGLRTSGQTSPSFELTTVSTDENEQTIDMKDSLSNPAYDALGGCQSQALKAVEDAELAAMANQMAGPWCTDDICTASLKDFADTMKGIFEIKQKSREGKHVDSDKQRAMAEEYITGVLGPQTAMASLLAVKDMWKPASQPRTKKNRIQNRVARAGGQAQARRLQQLRNKMTFSAASDGQNLPLLQVVSSFDDIYVRERWPASKQSETGQSGRGGSPGLFHGESHTNDEHAELFYDSDPEEYRQRLHKSGPRRVLAQRENMHEARGNKGKNGGALSSITMNRFLLGRRWKKLDDEIATEIIENMKNEAMTLIWHPTQTESNQNRPPVCVTVRIESGIYLVDGTFLLPKLTWIPFHEGSLQSRQLNLGQYQPESLDLLDVCRVRECDEINRSLHPFADVTRSFIVQTQSGLHLFETESKQERSRIVVGLKLVIARLASLLMLRDLRAVDEFFGGNSVPGEAPAWAAGRNERDQNAGPDFPTSAD